MAPSPDALDAAAQRLRAEASGLDDLVSGVIDPIRTEIPTVWVGPAADLFDRDLADHRSTMSISAGNLRTEAWLLEVEADNARAAAEAAAAAEEAAAAEAAESSGGGGGLLYR